MFLLTHGNVVEIPHWIFICKENGIMKFSGKKYRFECIILNGVMQDHKEKSCSYLNVDTSIQCTYAYKLI